MPDDDLDLAELDALIAKYDDPRGPDHVQLDRMVTSELRNAYPAIRDLIERQRAGLAAAESLLAEQAAREAELRAELERLRRVATEALRGYAEVWSLVDRISSEERQMTADEALTIYSLQSETVWEELRARGMDPSAAREVLRAALRERLAAAEADRVELERLRRVEARAAHLLRSRGSAAEKFAASALREELREELRGEP